MTPPVRIVVRLVMAYLAYLSAPALSQSPAPWVGETLWGSRCLPYKPQAFGPFDYTARARHPQQLQVVENAHFTAEDRNIGNLIREYDDLDYTLRAWPNHHEALNLVSIVRRLKMTNLRNFKYPPAECYLQRAINFAPHDYVPYMLYASVLHQENDLESALEVYKKAESLAPTELQLKYNLGLLLVDMGKHKEAADYAKEVYSEGFPLGGLRKQLDAAGYSIEIEPQ
jgi:tetratricopeptide (TPR) repeat protein